MEIAKCLMLAAVMAFGTQKGLSDMPMLNWMGREDAVKATKGVVMKILREDKSLGKCCQCVNVASTNAIANAKPDGVAYNQQKMV